MKKRVLSALLAVALMAGLTVQAMAAETTFADVSADKWYYTWVTKAASQGWVSGIGGGKFDPNGKVTYCQFATMLNRALYSNEFDAQPKGEYWWTPACEVADRHGLFADTDMASRSSWTSVANKPMEREEMAQMMYNALSDVGAKLPTYEEYTEVAMGIGDIIDTDNYDAVATCYAIKLLTGTGNGNFDPHSPMTRAQAAVVLCNVYGYVTGDVTGSTTTPNEPEKPTQTDTPRPAGAVGGHYDTNKYTVPADANKDGWITEAEVQAVLAQLKEEYPNRATYDPTAYWSSPVMGTGKECAYIAFMFSDKIFGNLPKRATSLENMRVGDVLKEPGHWSMTQNNYGDLSEQYRSINGGAKGVVSWTMLSRYDEWPSSGTVYSRYPKE